MSDLREIILIGEPDDDRYQWFEALLDEKFGKQSKQVKTLEDVKNFFKNQLNEYSVSLVFISDELPLSPKVLKKDPFLNFNTLQYIDEFSYVDFVCIVTKEDPDLEGIIKFPVHVHLPSFPPSADERQEIIARLRTLGRRLMPLIEVDEIARISNWVRESRVLRRQIRSLSETQDLLDGEKHLYRLIGNSLDCRSVEQIEIKQLGQGKSGASVFRLIVNYKDDPKKEYALKLSDLLWKLEIEVEGHLKATKRRDNEYTKHIPKIEPAFFPINLVESEKGRGLIVKSGHWYAIRYDFLGGENLGNFIDLETEMIAPPSELKDRTSGSSPHFVLDSDDWEALMEHRIKVLSTILDGLSNLWYSKFADRLEKEVWDFEDAPPKDLIPLPPYQLTQRVKGWVQDFLDSREASSIGNRLFPVPEWDKYVDSVLKIVGDEDNPSLGLFGKKIPFTLSPVHGDLNANNVLLWLEKDIHPFLIDLPFYQEKGHVLQDFARLETEIKFALMDRQEDSPDTLLAFDNDVSQVPLWIEMENKLLDNAPLNEPTLTQIYLEECEWNSSGYQNNVTVCNKAILLIRKKAFEIQQKIIAGKPTPAPFADEYLPALLYHTIRSIGYPSLSVFKRLLAVYSANSIINKMLER